MLYLYQVVEPQGASKLGINHILFAKHTDFKKKFSAIWDAEDINDLRPAAQKLRTKMKKILSAFDEARSEYKELLEKYYELKEDIAAQERRVEQYERVIQRHTDALAKQKTNVFFSPEEETVIINKIWKRHVRIKKKEAIQVKKENELDIVQNELQQAIEDTNLAMSSYYRLSETEIGLFENDRPRILSAVEQYGSIALACRKDKSIKLRVSSIMYYAEKHEEFKSDIEIARRVFKENLEADILDRAINGTETPVFQKGEFLGDYKFRDNKLLVEVAKANLPEKYDRKTHASLATPPAANNTVNIVSFAGVDETKFGYVKNIGVVSAVDSTGKVERITNKSEEERKMIKHYKEKGGAEIIEGEVVDDSVIE